MVRKPISVFVSATTQDLGSYRKVVKEELLTGGFHPVTQENFGPDFRDLTDFLEIKISECAAVICLVGHVLGAEPHGAEHTFSYTQLEYHLALKYKIPVFCVLTGEQFLPDQESIQVEEEAERQRLHREEIQRGTAKWDLFNDPGELKLHVARMVPILLGIAGHKSMFYLHSPRIPSYFVGREMELNQLREAYLRPSPSIIAVIGMGGQGKTTLVHQSLREGQSFPYSAGFWCTAYRGGFNFDLFLDEVLTYLTGGEYDKRDSPKVSTRVAILMRLLQNDPVLLVIDGIERWLKGWCIGGTDPIIGAIHDDRTAYHDGFDEFLTDAAGLENGTKVVLTSRALPAVLDHAACTKIPIRDENEDTMHLDGLSPEDSVKLLGNLGVKGDADDLEAAAERYGHHPLALTVLGGLIKKKFGGQLHRQTRDLTQGPRNELFLLLDETRKYLPGREGAERLLAVVSQCLENPDLATIAAGLGEGIKIGAARLDELLDHVIALTDWNLVDWDYEQERLKLHPLVKSYFAARVGDDHAQAIHENLMEFYENIPVAAECQTLAKVKPRLLAYRHAVLAKNPDRIASLMFGPMPYSGSFYQWLSAWGHQAFATELLGEGLDVVESEIKGIFHLARANLFQPLARPQDGIDDAVFAIELFGNGTNCNSRSRVSNLAKSYATRGNILRQTENSSAGIEDYDRAIEILGGLGDPPPHFLEEIAHTLVNRGNAKCDLGSLTEALNDYDKALELSRAVESRNPEAGMNLRAGILTSRGIIQMKLGALDSAVEDIEGALKLYADLMERSSGMEIWVARTKSRLGDALISAGNFVRAKEFLQDSISSFEKMVSAGRNDVDQGLAFALWCRGKIFLFESNFSSALVDCERSVAIYSNLRLNCGVQYQGAVSESLLLRAVIKFNLGEYDDSRADLDKGFALLRELMSDWADESDVLCLFMEAAINTTVAMRSDPDMMDIDVLDEALSLMADSLDHSDAWESLRIEAGRSILKLTDTLPNMKGGCLVSEMVEKFIRER